MHCLPNIITTLRIAGTPVFVFLVYEQNFHAALLLMILLAITDMLDGFLAKFFHWQSKFGAALDPLADKILLISALWAMYLVNLLPLWAVAVIFGRDVFVVAQYLVLRHRMPDVEIRPNWLGKLSTFLQFVLVLCALVSAIGGFPADWVIPLTVFAVAVAVVSAFAYMLHGWNLRQAVVTADLPKDARGSQYT